MISYSQAYIVDSRWLMENMSHIGSFLSSICHCDHNITWTNCRFECWEQPELELLLAFSVSLCVLLVQDFVGFTEKKLTAGSMHVVEKDNGREMTTEGIQHYRKPIYDITAYYKGNQPLYLGTPCPYLLLVPPSFHGSVADKNNCIDISRWAPIRTISTAKGCGMVTTMPSKKLFFTYLYMNWINQVGKNVCDTLQK